MEWALRSQEHVTSGQANLGHIRVSRVDANAIHFITIRMAPSKRFWHHRKGGKRTNTTNTKRKSTRERSLTADTVEDSTVNEENSDEERNVNAAKRVRWEAAEGHDDEKEASTTQDNESVAEEIQIINDKVRLCLFYAQTTCLNNC